MDRASERPARRRGVPRRLPGRGPPGLALPAPRLAGHRAQPLPARRRRRRAGPRPAVRGGARLRRRGGRSTSRRRPTTSPAAGRWRWWSSATSPAGCARTSGRPRSPWSPTVAASSFVGTSIFALSGLVLRDPALDVAELLQVDPGRGRLGRPAHAVRAAAGDGHVPAARAVPDAPDGRVPARARRLGDPQPAAPDRHPGAGVLAVRDPVRAALLPPGGQRRGVPRPGRLAVGARDRRAAAARADRRRHGPAAGRQPHLLGGLGRPHHARQDDRAPAAAAAARGWRGSWTSVRRRDPRRGWSPAATPAAVLGACWNGSPYQPVPVAADVRQAVALRILEQPEDFPGVLAAAAERARLPAAVRRQRSRTLLGYLSPITEDEYDQAQGRRRHLRQRRLVGRPGRRREGVRPLAARHARLPAGGGRLDGPGARRRRRGRRASPGDTLVTSIDAKVQGVVEQQLASTIKTARHDLRPGHPQELRRRLRRRRRDGGEDRPDRRDGQPADVRPRRSGSAASPSKQLARLYSEKAGTPLLGRAPRRASSRPARRGSRS